MSLRSHYHVFYIDLSDALRPPGLDVLLILVGALGAALVTIQPVADGAIASRIALDPTLFATALFLAVRGSAGVASLIQAGVMSLYLTYPLSKASLAVIIVISRVVLPSLLMLFIPITIISFLVPRVMLSSALDVLTIYSAFAFQAILYGLIFLFFAIRTRSQATSGLLSVAAYFAYVTVALILQAIGRSIGNESVRMFGEAMYFPEMVYRYYLNPQLVESWQLLLVPSAAMALFILIVIYFSRRFETI